MSTLADRLQTALDRRAGATQAGLAAHCGVKPPSVSAWFTGETKSLKATSLRKAAEYLGVDRDWLETGLGLPSWLDTPQGDESAKALAAPQPPPDLAQALPVVLTALAQLSPMQWSMVRGALDELHRHPEMHGDAVDQLLPTLQAAATAAPEPRMANATRR